MAGNAKSSFAPNSAATVTVAATTTSGSTRVALVGSASELLVVNAGPATAFLEIGSSTVTAAVATSIALLPGVYLTLGRPPGSTHVAAITAATTATVYVTTGEGD